MKEYQRMNIGANCPSPCKDCTERFIACSDRCQKDARGEFGYKARKAKRAEIEQKRREYIKSNYRPRKKWRDNYGSRKDPM